MKNQLKTKHLRLRPMTRDELTDRAANETDASRRAVYQELLSARAVGDPAHWHTAWRIERRTTGERVGEACLLGEPKRQTAELVYYIDETWRGQGYAHESIKALCDWAFSRGAYFITAEAEPKYSASQRVLGSCGFYCIGMGKAGELWEKEKPKSNWLAACLCLGLAVGCCLGAAVGRAMPGAGVSIGMGVGFAAGVAAGAALDRRDRQARQRGLAFQDEEADRLFSNRAEDISCVAPGKSLKEEPLGGTAGQAPPAEESAVDADPAPDKAADDGVKTDPAPEDAKIKESKTGAANEKGDAPVKSQTAEADTAGTEPPKGDTAKTEAAKPEENQAREGTAADAQPVAAAAKQKGDSPKKSPAAAAQPAEDEAIKANTPPKDGIADDEPVKPEEAKEQEPPKAG